MSGKNLTRVIFVVWLLAAGVGFGIFLNYQEKAGAAGHSPERWPQDASVSLDDHRNTLVMFLHPKCPCSHASLEELDRAITEAKDRATVHLFFLHPAGFSEAWVHDRLWLTACKMPGIQIHEDLDGKMAQLFAAETSGYVLLYDTTGGLIFKGGITESRGHAGDNLGKQSLVALLQGGSPATHETRVFGCALTDVCKMPISMRDDHKR